MPHDIPKINILDKHTAELIAAGEVIERPASIVKELLENSIDAKATSVAIEIKSGGKTYIRIIDNGCGIHPDDVKKAFLRNATSKVYDKEDLDSISTLGFRGEALASVCAVSKTEIITKTKDAEYGVKYINIGGEGGDLETAGCPNGTIITVRDLFFNVPARLKFLKQDSTEGNYVRSVVEKVALSHPEVSIKFIRDGNVVIHSPGNNDLYSAIYSIFGKEYSKSFIDAEYSNEKYKVSGFISIPTESRANRNMQFFFINGRYVKSPCCSSALEEAYKNSIMTGKFPACVLNIEMPYNEVDVNVHPHKTEVRFHDKSEVFNNVYFAVKSGIKKYNFIENEREIPIYDGIERRVFSVATKDDSEQLAFDDEKFPEESSGNPSDDLEQKKNFNKVFEENSIKTNPDLNSDLNLGISMSNLKIQEPIFEERDSEINSLNFKNDEVVLKKDIDYRIEKPVKNHLKVIGEIFNTYILAQAEDLFIIIDKHAAHERIIYERIKESDEGLGRQLLIKPFNITFLPNEYDSVINNVKIFERLGFLIEDFGNNSITVREIPSILNNEDCKQIVKEIADNIKNLKVNSLPERFERIYETMACKAAIKANDRNDISELEKLANDVYFNNDVRYCPHGRPVMTIMSKSKLERSFGR